MTCIYGSRYIALEQNEKKNGNIKLILAATYRHLPDLVRSHCSRTTSHSFPLPTPFLHCNMVPSRLLRRNGPCFCLVHCRLGL